MHTLNKNALVIKGYFSSTLAQIQYIFISVILSISTDEVLSFMPINWKNISRVFAPGSNQAHVINSIKYPHLPASKERCHGIATITDLSRHKDTETLDDKMLIDDFFSRFELVPSPMDVFYIPFYQACNYKILAWMHSPAWLWKNW